MPLTDLEIRRAKPADKTYTKADGNGLSLQIEPNGSKGWRFRYRYEGKAKMLSLGTYPKVSLSEARSKRNLFFGITGLFHGEVPPGEMEERPETSV